MGVGQIALSIAFSVSSKSIPLSSNNHPKKMSGNEIGRMKFRVDYEGDCLTSQQNTDWPKHLLKMKMLSQNMDIDG